MCVIFIDLTELVIFSYIVWVGGFTAYWYTKVQYHLYILVYTILCETTMYTNGTQRYTPYWYTYWLPFCVSSVWDACHCWKNNLDAVHNQQTLDYLARTKTCLITTYWICLQSKWRCVLYVPSFFGERTSHVYHFPLD